MTSGFSSSWALESHCVCSSTIRTFFFDLALDDLRLDAPNRLKMLSRFDLALPSLVFLSKRGASLCSWLWSISVLTLDFFLNLRLEFVHLRFDLREEFVREFPFK